MAKKGNDDINKTLENINEKISSIENKIEKINKNGKNKKETTFQAATLIALGFSMITLALVFIPDQFKMTALISDSVFWIYFVFGFFFFAWGFFHAIRKRTEN